MAKAYRHFLALVALTAPAGQRAAQAQTTQQVQTAAERPSSALQSGCVFDLSSLPRVTGKIERLLPGTQGDAVGAILTDGTEIEMPPGLAAQDHRLKAGQTLSIRGLQSSSLNLVRAFALTTPSGDLCAPPLPELLTSAPPATAESTVVRLLHDGNGALNGALLADGTVLRVPASVAHTRMLHLGSSVYADGAGYRTAYGRLIVATRLGPNRLQAIHVSNEAPVQRGAPPGSAGYDMIGSENGKE